MGGWKFPWNKKKSKDQSKASREDATGGGDTGAKDPEPKATLETEPVAPAEKVEVPAEEKAAEVPAEETKADEAPAEETKAEEAPADAKADEVKAEDVTVTFEEPKEEKAEEPEEEKAEEPKEDSPAEEPNEEKAEEPKEEPEKLEPVAEDEEQTPAQDATELEKIEEEQAPDDVEKKAADEPDQAQEPAEEPKQTEDEQVASGQATEDAKDAAEEKTDEKPKDEKPKGKGFLERIFPRSLTWSGFSKSSSFNAKDAANEKLNLKLPPLNREVPDAEPAKVKQGVVHATFASGAGATTGKQPDPETTPQGGGKEPDKEASPDQKDGAAGGADFGADEHDAGADEHDAADEGFIQDMPTAELVGLLGFAPVFGFPPLIPIGIMTHAPPEPPRPAGPDGDRPKMIRRNSGQGGAFPPLAPIAMGAFPPLGAVGGMNLSTSVKTLHTGSMGSWVPPVLPAGSRPVVLSVGPPAAFGFGTPQSGPRVIRQPSATVTSSTTGAVARPQGSSGPQRMASAPPLPFANLTPRAIQARPVVAGSIPVASIVGPSQGCFIGGPRPFLGLQPIGAFGGMLLL